MPQVIIDITPDGETTVEAQGFQGAQCKDATIAFEKALGTTTRDVKKPEYSQAKVTTSNKAKQR
jgi:hypothetical protein